MTRVGRYIAEVLFMSRLGHVTGLNLKLKSNENIRIETT